VTAAIAAYNDALALKDSLERTKSESHMTRGELATRSGAVCQRCHEPRNVARLTASQGAVQPSAEPRSVLTLHDMSGLLAECVAEARAAIDERRAELRSFGLLRAGDGKYYLHDAIPSGLAVERETWRVQVGNGPLAPAAIRLQGGGAVVGKVPQGVPALRAPTVDIRALLHLLPAALIISLLGFVEAIST
jgi:hypothetical protein